MIFAAVHQTLRVTPAMEALIGAHFWGIAEDSTFTRRTQI
jgi:hypothetical protein